jgi:ectoine hydroxylase-related dioxygenase (phytanoyl-CoA dioxygenase family)
MKVELTITDAETIRAYEVNGVCVVRNVLDQDWIARMGEATDRILADPSPGSMEYTPEEKTGRYYGDFFLWRRDPDFSEFMRSSPLPRLAAEFMQVEELRFFYDQLLVKEPRTAEHTPLHQDLPYWPIRGSQIISIWAGFDPVTEEAGAVQYVKGSHKWGKFYAPATFGSGSHFADIYREAGLEEMPDSDRLISENEMLFWDLTPGDVVVHHPLTLHFSPGNMTATRRRRGLALRYVGEDVTWDDRPGTFMTNPNLAKTLPPINLTNGESLHGELFPLIWKRAG